MKLSGAFLGLLLGLAPAAQAQTEAEQRARFEAGRAEQRRFEHSQFIEAGFASIAEVLADGREVRRVLLRDPYGMLPLPGIEVERRDDGRTTLRLQYRGRNGDPRYPAWSTDPVEIEQGAWDELAALEPALFARPVYQPVRSVATPAPTAPPPPPPPLCHAWLARFQADRARTASWTECGGRDGPGYRYAVRVAELAVGTKPGCPLAPGNVFGSFSACFSLTAPLDDPALREDYEGLRKAYDEAQGSERLDRARRALLVPDLTLGSPAWLEARAAVAAYKEVHDLQRDMLSLLVRLLRGTATISDADRAKLRYTIDNWTQSLRGQESNYSDLLQRLAWPEGAPGSRR